MSCLWQIQMPIQILPSCACFYISWWDANVQSQRELLGRRVVGLVFVISQQRLAFVSGRPGCIFLCVARNLGFIVAQM